MGKMVFFDNLPCWRYRLGDGWGCFIVNLPRLSNANKDDLLEKYGSNLTLQLLHLDTDLVRACAVWLGARLLRALWKSHDETGQAVQGPPFVVSLHPPDGPGPHRSMMRDANSDSEWLGRY